MAGKEILVAKHWTDLHHGLIMGLKSSKDMDRFMLQNSNKKVCRSCRELVELRYDKYDDGFFTVYAACGCYACSEVYRG